MAKALPLKSRYRYLTVLPEKVGRAVRCRCDCGNEKLVRPPDLVHGRTISCGCRFAETRYRKADRDIDHPEYFIWASMHRRCGDKRRRDYPRYGGRGITVCARWTGDGGFRRFLADMGNRPAGHSIERLDNDKEYSPQNCIWADAKQQARNQRRIKQWTYRGVTGSIAELCERFGKEPRNVRQRLTKLKWSLEAAMDTPTRPCDRQK